MRALALLLLLVATVAYADDKKKADKPAEKDSGKRVHRLARLVAVVKRGSDPSTASSTRG